MSLASQVAYDDDEFENLPFEALSKTPPEPKVGAITSANSETGNTTDDLKAEIQISWRAVAKHCDACTDCAPQGFKALKHEPWLPWENLPLCDMASNLVAVWKLRISVYLDAIHQSPKEAK